MRIEGAHFSQAGPKGTNEDAVLLPVQQLGIWWAGIADGMGGQPGGEIASQTVIETASSLARQNPSIGVKQIFEAARTSLNELARRDERLSRMGTTLTLVRLSPWKARIGHVGDTRVYHLRGEGILDRTRDQTEVQRLIDEGVLTKAGAKRYPRRNILLSVLSPAREYDLYEEEFDIKPEDRIILLTDGVYNKIFRREIRDLSLKHTSCVDFSENIKKLLWERNPEDDCTFLCISVMRDS